MKKFIAIAVLLAFVQSANAQFDFGPKVGYTTSTLSIDQSDISNAFKESFTFGVFARFGKKVYLQPEINWFTSGTVFKRPELNSINPIEQEITLGSIQIPLLVGIKLIDLEIVNLRVMGGGTANFVVDKQITSMQGSNYVNPIKESDIEDIHWGFQLGAGVDIAMFAVDVQYFVGLSNMIGTINVGGQPLVFDSRKTGFAVTIGWKIL